MKKLVLAGMVLGASYFAALPTASADGNPVAHIRITRGTNNCAAPGAGPGVLGYKCSYAMGTKDLPLTKNGAAAVDLPGGRTFQLTLVDVLEPKNKGEKRRFVVKAHHRKAGPEFIYLATITANSGEALTTIRFPHGSDEGLFLDMSIN